MGVSFDTSLGPVSFELYVNEAPRTVKNFEGLIERGYYNGTIFHRVIKNFMAQGGDPTGTGKAVNPYTVESLKMRSPPTSSTRVLASFPWQMQAKTPMVHNFS